MKRAYVIGNPIRHSMSPAIHNAAFAAVGIEARYEAVEVTPAQLQDWVHSVLGPDLLGFSVTVPHKEAIVPFLNEITGDATLTGAVNAVAVSPPHLTGEGRMPPPPLRGRVGEGGTGPLLSSTRLVGLNTDTVGFRRSLAEEAGVDLRGQKVVLLGAGGAARAIAVVAFQDGAASLVVANRHVERAERLLDELSGLNAGTRTSVVALDGESLAAALAETNVLVNATSVGLASAETPIDPNLVSTGILVVDLIYNPRETELLRAARERGARVLGGLGMLVYQAAAAFEAWTGVDPPIEVMRQAAEEALAAFQEGERSPPP